MTKKTRRVNENPPAPEGPRPKPAAAPPSTMPIVVKLVQLVRPGDVLVIECDEFHSQQQLQHLHKQLAAKLPEMRIVILNKGAHLANAQTIAASAATTGDDEL
jgi:hypothetical protein